jgi:FixJ family two-component response regulator
MSRSHGLSQTERDLSKAIISGDLRKSEITVKIHRGAGMRKIACTVVVPWCSPLQFNAAPP